jgi:hypothetical protein
MATVIGRSLRETLTETREAARPGPERLAA